MKFKFQLLIGRVGKISKQVFVENEKCGTPDSPPALATPLQNGELSGVDLVRFVGVLPLIRAEDLPPESDVMLVFKLRLESAESWLLRRKIALKCPPVTAFGALTTFCTIGFRITIVKLRRMIL